MSKREGKGLELSKYPCFSYMYKEKNSGVLT